MALDGATRPAGLRQAAGSRLAAALGHMLDRVMPPQCAVCGAPVECQGGVCAPCWGRIDFIAPPYCARLGTPFAFDPGPGALSPAALAADLPYDRVRAVALYGGPARDMVVALKFSGRVALAPVMASWMARAGHELLPTADLVVPVPMHWLRLARRRHNHAALLARHLASRTGLSVLPDGLRRRRNTPPQTGLSAGARERNLSGAIVAARPDRLRGARILLVDDVFTTGATALACARALRRAGAAGIDILAFARVAGDRDRAI